MSEAAVTPGPVYTLFGATGGIGENLARRLAKRGARLALIARQPERLHRLADELGAWAEPVDATRLDDVDGCMDRVIQHYGRLDGAVNCVGSLLLKAAHLTTEAEWHATMAANLTTSFAVVRSAARIMLSSGGCIVLVSSVAARVGLANHEAIAAAKAGVIGLTLAAAATYANRGIRVNCVAPGLVRTPLTARLTSSEVALKASLAMHPLGRIGEPADVASAIDWLLQPEQSWITGQVLGVDGGLASARPR